MQFVVSKSALCHALSLVAGAVEKRTTIPILSNVKLEAAGESLTVSATDLEIALVIQVAARVEAAGVVTIPAKKLESYVRLLPEGDIRFKLDEKQWATITAGRARTRISGMAADSFPELPSVPASAVEIPAGAFLELVQRVRFAISTVESRFTLNGALFEHKGGRLQFVATDGHRLALAWAELAGEQEMRFLFPRAALEHIAKFLEGAEKFSLAQDENHVFLRSGASLLVARKMSGNFPDYQRVLPKEAKIAVAVNRVELAGALSRVAQFADMRSRAVRVSLKEGGLEIFTSSMDTGESTETVPCGYAGEPLEIGFNADYIGQFLAVTATETVDVQLTDAKCAGEFRPTGSDKYRYVVMPMRI